MNKNVIYKKLISYFKEKDNIILNEADINIMLKEGFFIQAGFPETAQEKYVENYLKDFLSP